MQVLHVNRAEPQIVVINGKDVLTGIYKEPVQGAIPVHKLGMEGDGQADLTVHGGPFQALYAYPIEHYAYWENELGAEPFPPRDLRRKSHARRVAGNECLYRGCVSDRDAGCASDESADSLFQVWE